MNSLVSIIVPSYNKAEFIGETIISVQNQTYNNWELIIIDDNSTDNSWELIKNNSNQDKRIRCFKNDSGKKGGSICRNIGIKKSKGEYLIFLDADDILIEKCLEQRISKIKNLDFAVFPMAIFKKNIGDTKALWNNFSGNHLNRFLSHDLPWSVMMPLWRRDFLLSLQGFQEDFPRLQDVELHTRALLNRNASYECFGEVKPDCFYRTDLNRRNEDPKIFVMKQVDGTLKYLNYFEQQLSSLGLTSKVKFLSITLFKSLNHIFYAKEQEEISKEDSKYFIDMLLSDKTSETILNSKNKAILSVYQKIKFCGIRFKGINLLFKSLLRL